MSQSVRQTKIDRQRDGHRQTDNDTDNRQTDRKVESVRQTEIDRDTATDR